MTTPESARLIAGLQDLHDHMRDGFASAEPSKKLLRDAIDALAALSQTDEARDAARYRWLRDERSPCNVMVDYVDEGLAGEEMDAEVDAAMSKEQP